MSTRTTPRRLFVGLSGGVDSAVAAGLLKAEGHDVQAVFMKNWEEDDTPGHCAAATDLADARAVADALGIPLHAVNFATEYWDRVFAHFLAEYRAGRTPNPDVLCNREIKFRAFLDHALARGADAVATGHYARVVARADGVHLARSADEAKDQTYFLYQLDQSQLRHACFIGERRFRDFLARYLPAQPGDVELPDGRRVGRHGGLLYYTPGQRHGLALGGVRGAGEAPWFVVGKDLARNVLVTSLVARPLHWVLGAAPATTFRCLARCRHRQPLQDCTVEVGTDGSARVVFAERQRALAPGQSVVWYQGADCLGGGVIDAVGE